MSLRQKRSAVPTRHLRHPRSSKPAVHVLVCLHHARCAPPKNSTNTASSLICVPTASHFPKPLCHISSPPSKKNSAKPISRYDDTKPKAKTPKKPTKLFVR